MTKNNHILNQLKKEIKDILAQLKLLRQKKQEEVKKINESIEKYAVLSEMILPDLPVNDDTFPIFEAIQASGDSASAYINNLFHDAVMADGAYTIVTSTGSAAMLSIASAQALSEHLDIKVKHKALELYSHTREQAKQEIVDFLRLIAPHLESIYLSVYESLDLISTDPARNAVAVMREVINQTLTLLAPDKDVLDKYGKAPKTPSGISWANRIKYIAETKTTDETSKKLILNMTKLFRETINDLSGTLKERAETNIEKAKARLYQAEHLLKTLAELIHLEKNL